MQNGTRKRISNLISNILNPFLVGLVLILLLSFESTSTPLEGLRWSLIMIVFSVLPVFAVTVYFVHSGSLDGIFTSARQQRTKIYMGAGICAVAGCVIFPRLGAPSILVAAFVAGLSAILVFMCINLWWKISLHTGFVAASVTVLVIMYGSLGMLSLPLLPLIAWARTDLNHHSPAQVTVGALLAASIVTLVFYLFGLI
ncbi:hypothetical protein ACFLX4_02055 [Chloroflexota bacterium]